MRCAESKNIVAGRGHPPTSAMDPIALPRRFFPSTRRPLVSSPMAPPGRPPCLRWILSSSPRPIATHSSTAIFNVITWAGETVRRKRRNSSRRNGLRVSKPAGRSLLSACALWIGHRDRLPNPRHRRVFDYLHVNILPAEVEGRISRQRDLGGGGFLVYAAGGPLSHRC